MTPAKHQAFMAAAAASIVYTKSPLVATGAASLLGSCWALVQCMNRPVTIKETPRNAAANDYASVGSDGHTQVPAVSPTELMPPGFQTPQAPQDEFMPPDGPTVPPPMPHLQPQQPETA